MYPDFYLQFWKISSKVSSLTNIINSNDQNFSFHNIHANILFLFCFFLMKSILTGKNIVL